MRRAALLFVAAASLGAPVSAHAAGSALRVRAELAPTAPLFADPVVARIEIDFDSSTIDSDRIEVRPSFSPYAPTGSPTRSLQERGGRGVLVLRYRLTCLTEECVPGVRPRRLELSGGQVRAGGRKAPIVLPALEVRGRVRQADVGRTELPFRAGTALPPPSYRVAPGPFSDGLLAAAALLALCGAALLRPPRRRVPAARAVADGLQRALRLLQESLARRDPDRRKALDLLARELRRSDRRELAGSARSLAWSPDGPDPPRIEGLARDVERAKETT